MSEALTTYVLPERQRRRPGAVVALAVAVVATLAAGAFAAVSFGATDGSATPEAAVEKLVAAVEAADPVGVLESLAPGERASLRPGIEGLAGQLERLGVLEDGFELGPVSGVDVDIDGLRLSSAALGDGVSAVAIEAGTITTATDLGALPLGPLVGALVAGAVSPPPDVVAEDLSGSDASVIVAIEEGGGWHVSLWYTVAEAARRASGKAAPAFGGGVAPDGAESPEAALSAVAGAALDLDAAGVIAVLDPDEARALQDYAPLFLPDAEAAAARVRADGYALRLDRLDTTVARDGGPARVTVDGFAVSGHLPGEGAVSVSFDGDCISYESDADGREEQCLDDLTGTGAGSVAGDARMAVTAVERGGRWHLSPTRTVLDGLVEGLAEVDAGDLTDLAGTLGGLLGRGMFGAGAPGEGAGASVPGEQAEGAPPDHLAALERCAAVLEQAPATGERPGAEGWQAYPGCLGTPLPGDG